MPPSIWHGSLFEYFLRTKSWWKFGNFSILWFRLKFVFFFLGDSCCQGDYIKFCNWFITNTSLIAIDRLRGPYELEFYSRPPARNSQYLCHVPLVQPKHSDIYPVVGTLLRVFNNYSSSPNGLWVDSPWSRRPNGLLTQRPWGREE